MNGVGRRWVWIAAAVLVAGLLRLPGLARRPMHTDEAVHAVKLGQLLDQGTYRYDPHEYHGPTLNYLTWPIAALRGQHRYADLDEVTLRLVPALCGLGLVLFSLIFRNGLGWKATFLAMIFTAVSPGLVFYSRYYIQETLLVFFTFGLIACGWRYLQDRRWIWAVLAGACAGLMHATKETAVMAWVCLVLAGILTWLWSKKHPAGIHPAHAAWALFAAILVSALFYSSFLTNPKGILDSLGPFSMYAERAGTGRHIHPWHYYLDLLTWVRFWERPRWNEDFTVLMAAVGLVWVLRRPTRTCSPWLARFLALYTLAMTMVYSAIPYKTPWCMLGFLHGMILMSAIAVAELTSVLHSHRAKTVSWAAALVFGIAGPLAQACLLNTRYDSVPSNPYVYAHTTRDIFLVRDKVQAVAAVHPKGKALYVQVICPEADYWPLPWYLRDFTSVGYWSEVDFNAPPGDVILANPVVEPNLIRLLYEIPAPGSRPLYLPLLPPGTRLRPGVKLDGYVRKDLWDALSDLER
jgi:uncharacterized protein (TIGR03663 family)